MRQVDGRGHHRAVLGEREELLQHLPRAVRRARVHEQGGGTRRADGAEEVGAVGQQALGVDGGRPAERNAHLAHHPLRAVGQRVEHEATPPRVSPGPQHGGEAAP